MLALAFPAISSAAEYEPVDRLPKVNNFASARFDLLTSIGVGAETQVGFGKGAVIAPDRTSIWISMAGSDKLTYIVQIGTSFYINDGSGWQKTDNIPVNALQGLSVAEQLTQLEQNANAILKVGAEPVRGAATTHYQVWLSGDRALELSGNAALLDENLRDLVAGSTYKYDFWIGDQDGLLYQQNTVVTTPDAKIGGIDVPGGTFSTLVTFYDFNDSSITIQPPI